MICLLTLTKLPFYAIFNNPKMRHIARFLGGFTTKDLPYLKEEKEFRHGKSMDISSELLAIRVYRAL